MEKARWVGKCPSCGWGREFEAKSETEQRNPYPSGERCKICGKDFVFLERAKTPKVNCPRGLGATVLTFNQIEELRQGNEVPSRSLQSAARNVGIEFEQCPECNGHGYTKATLLASMTVIAAMAKECPKEPVPILYDRCERCHGDGGWLLSD